MPIILRFQFFEFFLEDWFDELKERKRKGWTLVTVGRKTVPLNREIRGQFHQRSTRSFYVRKLHVQLFCAYVLGLYFMSARLLAQKLGVECW
jgi:hypothetical protein